MHEEKKMSTWTSLNFWTWKNWCRKKHPGKPKEVLAASPFFSTLNQNVHPESWKLRRGSHVVSKYVPGPQTITLRGCFVDSFFFRPATVDGGTGGISAFSCTASCSMKQMQKLWCRKKRFFSTQRLSQSWDSFQCHRAFFFFFPWDSFFASASFSSFSCLWNICMNEMVCPCQKQRSLPASSSMSSYMFKLCTISTKT